LLRNQREEAGGVTNKLSTQLSFFLQLVQTKHLLYLPAAVHSLSLLFQKIVQNGTCHTKGFGGKDASGRRRTSKD